MVDEFGLTVVRFARPGPMQICACAWTKKLWKIKTGLPGLRVAGRCGPLGLRGPLAAGHESWAAGRESWATGLLLAKPMFLYISHIDNFFE